MLKGANAEIEQSLFPLPVLPFQGYTARTPGRWARRSSKMTPLHDIGGLRPPDCPRVGQGVAPTMAATPAWPPRHRRPVDLNLSPAWQPALPGSFDNQRGRVFRRCRAQHG